MQHVRDENFESEVLDSTLPVLVDLWAEWCGPCKMIAPMLDELDAERKDVKFVKVNIDDNPKTPDNYGVRSIPTLLLFKGGEEIARQVGAGTKEQINLLIEDNLI